MTRRVNNDKVIKAISIGLAAYMALSPVAVRADELTESVAGVEQAVGNTSAETDAQGTFEEAVADVDVSDINSGSAIEDTSALVEEEINRIENEAVKEAADSIIDVDMTNVDEALDKVTELVDDSITDEVVADELEAAADALINIYDSQAAAALNALKVISADMDAVTVLEDGTVLIDWNAATEEVTGLYSAYQAALTAKDAAQTAKDQSVEKKNELSEKVDKLNVDTANKNRETILDSKQNKSEVINELITTFAESKKSELKKDFAVSGNDGKDIYKFFINVVEDGVAYGCLTYYDSANMTILRKNFKIAADGIDYYYAPKAEWVRDDPNCTSVIFGNSGNYIAAYIGSKTSSYIDSKNEFKGKDVSVLMQKNVELNNAIEAREAALNDLENISEVIEKAEAELKDATDKADAALLEYKEAVAMYKKAAALDSEIKKSEVEKAKLEYVKAEVEAWRKQQTLNQIKDAANNDNSNVINENQEGVETVINNIAVNLGADPKSVEEMVVQTIIDTDNASGAAVTNEGIADETKQAVAGERVENNAAVSEGDKKVASADEKAAEEVTPEIVTIDENEVPLANVGNEANSSWWKAVAAALAGAAGIFAVFKRRKEEEEEKEA